MTRASGLALEEMFLAATWRRIIPHPPACVARALRTNESRLRRILSGVRPSLDLALRLRMAFDLPWPQILIPRPPDNIVAGLPIESAREFTEAEVRARERGIRERLRKLILRRGLKQTANELELSYHTLRSYLMTVRIPLAVVWQVHLLTGTPYSTILEGKPDPEELNLAGTIGRPDDPYGRLSDLDEPFIRNIEFFNRLQCFSRADPYIKRLRRCARRKNSLRQQARLMALLSQYELRSGGKPGSDRKGSWSITRKLPYYRVPALQELAVALHHCDRRLMEEIGAWIFKHATDPETRAETQLILSAAPLSGSVPPFKRCEVEESLKLTRKAGDLAWRAGTPHREALLASVGVRLALLAWMTGSPREALAHLASALETPLAVPILASRARDLEFHIRIWLSDLKGARIPLERLTAWPWSEYPSSSSQDIDLYRMRWLVLKQRCEGALPPAEGRKLKTLADRYARRDPGKLTNDGRLLHAVCMFRVRGETKFLQDLMEDYTSKRGQASLGFFAFPDFLDAVREAELWGPAAEKWRGAMEKQGFRVFSIPRPDPRASTCPSHLRLVPTPLMNAPRQERSV